MGLGALVGLGHQALDGDRPNSKREQEDRDQDRYPRAPVAQRRGSGWERPLHGPEMLGRGPPETVDLPALLLRRPARAGRAQPQRLHPGRRWWTVVDEALRRDRGSDSLVEERHDLEDSLAPGEGLDPVADLHRRRRFRSHAIHAHMPAATRRGRRGPALVEPDRPQPRIHPCRSALRHRVSMTEWRVASSTRSRASATSQWTCSTRLRGPGGSGKRVRDHGGFPLRGRA